jgi:RNA polymerase sigma-70 factor (ECF subfamily)
VPLRETERLAAGDPAAFAALYDRLGGRLYATARTLIHSPHDAEDLVQDLFVDLARSRHRLVAVTDLDAYLFTMLRHAVGRRRRRLTIGLAALLRLAADRPSSRTSRVATTLLPDDDLSLALADLPEPQRQVVMLKTEAGLTFAEIAVVIGTSLNTAASRYRYAIEKLRAALTTQERRS